MGNSTLEGEPVSRRFFIRATVAGSAIASTVALTEIERETKVFETGLKLTSEAPDFLTFLRTKDQFSLSPVFHTTLCKMHSVNIVALLGDSIIRGGVGRQPLSFANVFADRQQAEGKGVWEIHNWAEHGVTTDMIIHQQVLSDRAAQDKYGKHPLKIFIHAGANNVKGVADTKQKVEKLRYLARNPINLELLDVVSEVMDDIRKYEKSFSDLLSLVVKEFGKHRIENIVVFATPDLSKAPKISTVEINNEMTYVPISDNPFAQFFVRQGTLLLDNHMIFATKKFKENNPEINISAVNAFDLGSDCYTDDEHPNDTGKRKIADKLSKHLIEDPA